MSYTSFKISGISLACMPSTMLPKSRVVKGTVKSDQVSVGTIQYNTIGTQQLDFLGFLGIVCLGRNHNCPLCWRLLGLWCPWYLKLLPRHRNDLSVWRGASKDQIYVFLVIKLPTQSALGQICMGKWAVPSLAEFIHHVLVVRWVLEFFSIADGSLVPEKKLQYKTTRGRGQKITN